MSKPLILGLLVLTLVGAVLGLACGKEAGDKTTPLPLVVTEPQDESVVYTSQVVVKGTTSADSVVTANGVVADVDADGKFSVTVTLEEGPNLIEILASDFQYREASDFVTVIYEIR